VSDTQQGPGWWQASDGKWYPPASPVGPAAFQAQPKTEGLATTALVMGIVGLVLCPFIGAILALVFGFQARSRIRDSGGALAGDGLATAGIVLGFIGLVLPGLAIIAVIAIALLGNNVSVHFSSVGNVISLIH